MKEWLNKNWVWLLLAVFVGIIFCFSFKRKDESAYNEEKCMDCGPGGMFGPGAAEVTLDPSSPEYIRGRQIAMARFNKAVSELGDVMKIPGVYGYGPVSLTNHVKKTEVQYIGVDVKDEATRQKVTEWVGQKQRALKLIGGSEGLHYYEYPVKVVIREQTKAQ